MSRSLIALACLILAADTASAGLLPWPYYVRFQAANGAQTILLGTDTRPGDGDVPPTPVYLAYPTGVFGPSRIHFQTATGTESLFEFGYGQWDVSDTPLPAETTAVNMFDLHWGFQGPTETAGGTDRGSIAVSDIYTSGTGNFVLGLDVTHDITLDGRRALVRFHAVNEESVSRIEMTVTELPPMAETPEPVTLLLAGVGLAGVGLWRKRRKQRGIPAVGVEPTASSASTRRSTK